MDPLIVSSEVHEEVHSSKGMFTAYRDGRIKAKLSDRTIVNMNADGTECLAILPDGKHLSVSCDVPLGIEDEVAAVLDFRDWAFSTLSERQKMAQAYEKIEQQAIKCRLNAAMCRWTAAKRTTPSSPINQ